MTWCSVRAELVPIGAAVVAAAFCAGCPAGEEVFETQVLVVAETELCEEARDMGRLVNAYRVILYEFGGTGGDTADNRCLGCLRTGNCTPVAQACICAPPLPPATNTINGQLAGLRLEDLDPEQEYCIGLQGFHIESIPDGVSRRCPCDLEGLDLTRTGRVCGVSIAPGTVDENSAAFLIGADCRFVCPLTAPDG